LPVKPSVTIPCTLFVTMSRPSTLPATLRPPSAASSSYASFVSWLPLPGSSPI